MGLIDRIIRILIALAVLILHYTHVISGTLAIILLVISGVLVLTSIISFCPIYLPFGLSTGKKKE